MRLAILAAVAALTLSGCTTMGSAVSSVVVSATSASPSQAKTVAEAAQATTLAERAADLYVRSGNPSKPVLMELQTLVTALHNTLKAAEAANAAGNSATAAAGLAAFNEALAAYQAYATKQGVSQ